MPLVLHCTSDKDIWEFGVCQSGTGCGMSRENAVFVALALRPQEELHDPMDVSMGLVQNGFAIHRVS